MINKTVRNMPKDRWLIPVPAEYSRYIGLEQGKLVNITLDDLNDRIIITKFTENSVEKSEVPPKKYSRENILSIIKELMEEYDLESDLYSSTKIQNVEFKSYKTGAVETPKVEKPKCFCAKCKKELRDDERFKLNYKRICTDCKKQEMQKFLLWLEERKLNEKEKGECY